MGNVETKNKVVEETTKVEQETEKVEQETVLVVGPTFNDWYYKTVPKDDYSYLEENILKVYCSTYENIEELDLKFVSDDFGLINFTKPMNDWIPIMRGCVIFKGKDIKSKEKRIHKFLLNYSHSRWNEINSPSFTFFNYSDKTYTQSKNKFSDDICNLVVETAQNSSRLPDEFVLHFKRRCQVNLTIQSGMDINAFVHEELMEKYKKEHQEKYKDVLGGIIESKLERRVRQRAKHFKTYSICLKEMLHKINIQRELKKLFSHDIKSLIDLAKVYSTFDTENDDSVDMMSVMMKHGIQYMQNQIEQY